VAEAEVGASRGDVAPAEKVDEVVSEPAAVVQEVDERGYRYSPEEMAAMTRTAGAGAVNESPVSLVEKLAARGVGMRGAAVEDAAAARGTVEGARAGVGSAESAKRDKKEFSASLEQAIGGRWYALIGAVIVLIGLGLFLKLAVDQGWLSFSPVARCVVVGLAGFGLIAGGEWAMRKASRFAAAGFSAAGVGALIAAVWAAERLYGLLGDGPAFVLLAVACAIGVGVAARLGLASVAVVSLIGAYLNPIIVGAESDDSRGFMAYLLLLLATGLVLPWWKGRAFAGVRSLAWWGTMLLGSVACGAEIVSNRPESAIVFAVMAWGMVHVELMSSAGRFGFGVGRKQFGSGDADGGAVVGELAANERMTFGEVLGSKMTGPSVKRAYFNARPLMASFSSTAWATVFVSFALQKVGGVGVWLGPAGFLAATLACAHVLSGHLRYLKDVPKTDGERLGVSLALQAGSLLIATVALALSGSAQSVAWVGMGVGAVAAGRWIRARGLDGYGLVVLAIALVRVLVYDRFAGGGATTAIEVAGLELGVWNVIALSCAGGVIGASWLTRREANATWRSVGSVVAGVGVIALAIALVGTTEVGPAVVAVVGMMGCAAGGMGMWYRSKGLGVLGVAMSVFAVGVLAPGSELVGQRGTGGVAAPAAPLGLAATGLAFGAWFVAGVLCAVSIAVQGWMVRERAGAWRSVSNVLVAFAVVVMACAPIVQGSAGPAWLGVAAVAGVCAMWLGKRLASESLAATGIAMLLGGLVLGPIAGGWRDEGVTLRMLGGVVMSGWVAGYLVLAGAWGIGRALTGVNAVVEGASERGQGEVDASASVARALASDRLAARAKEVVLSSGMVLAAVMAPVHPKSWGVSMCVWWVVVGLTAVVVSVRTRWTELVMAGLVAIGGATCAWLWSYGHVWNGWERDAGPILLSGGLWSGLFVAAGLGAAAWIVRGARERLDWWVSMGAGRLVKGLATCTVVMLWLSTSMEAGRVGEIVSQERTFQRAAVSVWWGLFGLGLITAGFLWRGKEGAGVATARRAGLAMVAVAVLKALAWDLTQVSAIARVISFVGLGLLMMAVTVVYAKLAGKGNGAHLQSGKGGG
jgi:uncharacterized membrane protein